MAGLGALRIKSRHSINRIPIRLWLVTLALAAMSATASAQKLKSPWDGQSIALTDAPYKCPDPPPFTKSMDAESYYTDANHSIIDEAKRDAFRKATEAPTHLGQWAGEAADAYLMKGSREAAACVYSLLSAAAEAKAWTATMPTGQATYEQKWMLAGTAMAYLKVRNTGVGTPAQDKTIQNWLGILADRIKDYVDDKRKNLNSDAWNNHLYWAGLAVAASGVARNDPRDLKWGIDAYKTGVGDIQPSGVLMRELARAGMALHYHLYALAPLIMIAELGEANGQNLYAENKGAIHRLVAISEAGLKDPSIFKKATGVEQNLPDTISGAEIGWAVPYVKRFPDPQLSHWIADAKTTRFWQWGGLPPD
jgi:poly(beta-D-mannuronate) lyase